MNRHAPTVDALAFSAIHLIKGLIEDFLRFFFLVTLFEALGQLHLDLKHVVVVLPVDLLSDGKLGCLSD